MPDDVPDLNAWLADNGCWVCDSKYRDQMEAAKAKGIDLGRIKPWLALKGVEVDGKMARRWRNHFDYHAKAKADA